MDVSYSAGWRDVDQPAHDAAAERPNRPVRLRIQPTLLRASAGKPMGNHKSWQGVSWSIECRSAQEAIEVRKAMQAFFTAIGVHGAPAVEKALTAAARIK